jgi:dTMP kinase
MFLNQGPGRFIVLEGLDGAGTTTQAKLIHDWLIGVKGICTLTQEPSSGPAGVQLRTILTGRLKVDPLTIAYVFAADRLDHLYNQKSGIKGQLEGGCHVICDRYYLSSLAYQSLDADMGWIYQLNSRCIQPDLTLFLDVSPETCWKRITANRGTHYEIFEELEKLREIDRRYQLGIEYLQKRGENIHVIKGDRTPEEVFNDLKARILALIDQA